MKHFGILLFVLFILCIAESSKLKKKSSLHKKPKEYDIPYSVNIQAHFNSGSDDDEESRLRISKTTKEDLSYDANGRTENEFEFNNNLGEYKLDPVLNNVRRSLSALSDVQETRRRKKEETIESETSSSEADGWRDEFKEIWLKKKFEAINMSEPRGDIVNMVAARPWGVNCGDLEQHGALIGSCVMQPECDAEYRIYRGDHYCGNTEFVCCSLQTLSYDVYQGFDLSFEDSRYSSNSDEGKEKSKGKGSKDRKKNREKRNRQKARRKRKKNIKKQITKIVHEMRKILNRAYRNASHKRRWRTKLLKKYVKDLKKQYKKDRKTIRDVHDLDLIQINAELSKKLSHLKEVNYNFMMNETFRDIITSGKINKVGARMLVEAYPELREDLRGNLRRSGGNLRRSGGGYVGNNERAEYLDYDIEYGALYY